jgi:hypothetical protein
LLKLVLSDRSGRERHRHCFFSINPPFFQKEEIMAVSEQVTALIASFHDRRQAERFLDELKHAGFRPEEYGLVAPHDEETPVEEGAIAGAITGGSVGLVAGAAATGLVPGIGPIVAGGLLTGLLGGAAAGATAGGILGALIGIGVPEDQAHKHADEFLAGRVLVVVQAVGRGAEALAIVNRINEEAERDAKD